MKWPRKKTLLMRNKRRKQLKRIIFDRDNYTCVGCGFTPPLEERALQVCREFERKPKVYLTVDHIIPLSRGGTDEYSNLQTMCNRCNSEKGNLLPEDLDALDAKLG